MTAIGDIVVLENLAAGRTSTAMPATVVSLERPTCFVPTGVAVLRLVPTHGGQLPRVLPARRLMSDEFVLNAAAQRHGVEHTIKKMDGTIGEKNSYGNPPPG